MSRSAVHAGSWYSSRRNELDAQLTKWLAAVPATLEGGIATPVAKLKAIIAPHAGFRYSGPSAAYSYRAIDPEQYDRVFILGPSHHFYLDGCALSKCSSYETPIGDLPLDAATMAKLKATGKFSEMQVPIDEDEHSIEMHLPYVRKVFEKRKDIQIVPILVGSISTEKEKAYGAVLAPYLADARTLFVISSDFCHWGTRFNYTFYRSSAGQVSHLGRRSSSSSSVTRDVPIHASIEALDREGMHNITISPPADAHDTFAAYLTETRNTICGRHPIGILLATLASLPDSAATKTSFVRYEQSSACETLEDSSVSYACAVSVLV